MCAVESGWNRPPHRHGQTRPDAVRKVIEREFAAPLTTQGLVRLPSDLPGR